MTAHTKKSLGRLIPDQRGGERRDDAPETVLSSLVAFEGLERDAFKRLDRRKCLRRHADIQRRIARQ